MFQFMFSLVKIDSYVLVDFMKRTVDFMKRTNFFEGADQFTIKLFTKEFPFSYIFFHYIFMTKDYMTFHLPLALVDRSKYVANTNTYKSPLIFNSIIRNEVCLRMKDKR